MSLPFNPKLSMKLQINNQDLSALNKGTFSNQNTQNKSFEDYVSEAFNSTIQHGHEIESLGADSHNTTDLALAMDQFLMELSTLKALVDETRKALDRVFQEGKA